MTERPAAAAVIIPALDEQASIAAIVARLSGAMPVIVVDDGSRDETSARAMAAGAIVVRNAARLGYDAALRAGFAEAARRGFARVVTMDADGEHDPALVQRFLDALGDVPLVLGRRPRRPRFAEILFGLYVRSRYGVHDILCGMKGYDMALYSANGDFDHCRSIGTELAIFALDRGMAFREIPVSGRPRPDRPRFGGRVAGNLRILAGMGRVLRERARWRRRDDRTVASIAAEGVPQ